LCRIGRLIAAKFGLSLRRAEVSRDRTGPANMNTIAKAEVPGLTKAQNLIQTVLLIAVSIITEWTLYMVSSWQAPGDPFLLAAASPSERMWPHAFPRIRARRAIR
jgi:hypothetical protein